MFKLELDAGNHLLCASIGRALLEYGSLGLGTLKPDDGLSEDERDALAMAADLGGAGTCMNSDCENPNCPDHFDQSAATTGRTDASTASTANTPRTDSRIDTNGVPFDIEFCGEAKEPFYASGKDSGQWKRKRNLAVGAYDAWYAEALLAVVPPDSGASTEGGQIDTAGAFSGSAATTTEPAAPTNCGQFMAWVSEMQAAKRLTQDDVNTAYTQCNITMTDLFPPNTAEQVAVHVASLHANLSAVAAQ